MHVTQGKHNRGVALIMVLVIIALATIIATQLITMRGIYSQRTQNVTLSDNAWGYAVGAETLARMALDEALKNEDTVHLGQLWASQTVVFPIDGGQLTASLTDLRGCFNINMMGARSASNPIGEDQSQRVAVDNNKALPGQMVFQNLLRFIAQQSTDAEIGAIQPELLAARLRDWIDTDSVPAGFEGAEDQDYMGFVQPYRAANQKIVSVSELRTVSGFTPDLIDVLAPYVCVIPDNEDLVINVNTIPVERAELLAALYENMTLDTARSIISSRPAGGFESEDYDPLVPADSQLIKGVSVDFTSSYFAAMIEVELGQTRTRLKSLLFYNKSGSAVQTLARLGHND
ncbi:MAG: type II secretion system minor pseudopilin GspK [Gammaproteobacteria bacterium]|jgi:general secretion pathway protein K